MYSFEQAKRGFTQKQILEDSAFIFTSLDGQLVFFDLRKNFTSIEYDPDYIIFGKQQICIPKFGNELLNLSINQPSHRLHFGSAAQKR